MTTGAWSDELLTGFTEIDEQHRELFAAVDRLNEALARGELSVALHTVHFVERYVLSHFAAEEALMRSRGFPGLEGHTASHDAFVQSFLSKRANFEAEGSLGQLMVELSDWLGAWLHNHVCTSDAEMARYLRSAVA